MSGTAGAQAIGVLILPLLARLFTPEAFGVFQVYLSILVFCTVAIGLRIELTLLSKEEGEAHQTAATLFGLVLVISAAFTIVLAAYSYWVKGLGFPIFFLGLGLVGNGFTQVTSYKLIRDQLFSKLAVIKVTQAVVYSVVAIAIALLKPTVWGIIAADVTGRLAAGMVAFRAIRSGGEIFAHARRIGQLGGFVRRHWELALISLPGALANSGGAMLTPFMIFHVYGAAAAGQYGLVDRSLGVPVAMLVNAGSQVFAGRVTERIRGGARSDVRKFLLRTVIGGAIVSGLGAVIAYFIIPFVFRVAFGAAWGEAAQIARILVFSYAIALVTGLINQTLVALGAYRLQSMWDVSWPICIGTVWAAVVLLKLDLFAAVTLHASVVGGLGIAFVVLCLIRLRGSRLHLEAAEG